jgi:phosphoglycolate phosphatase-like HAD superfamily hydrolase
MQLLLFDIDGTLVHANGTGRDVLELALLEVFGHAGPIAGYSFAGKVDLQIVFDLMGATGLDPATIHQNLPALFEKMVLNGQRLFSAENGVRPCPGVPELLDQLTLRRDLILGLLTGNVEGTAPLKLASAGIDPTIFRLGAYGSDAANRDDLPAVALSRAAALNIQHTGTIIIGDTPADIQCAQVAGVTSIAVATGFYSREQLAACQPDYLLDDLTDIPAFLSLVCPDASA